jgi:hypothetical protein
MNDVLKTFGCVAAYAGGLVIGLTAAGIVVGQLEKKSIARSMNKLSGDLDGKLPYVSKELGAAMADAVEGARAAARQAGKVA